MTAKDIEPTGQETEARFNPQLYENSPLCGSKVEQDSEEDPEGFWNAKKPNLVVLHENPRNRLVIYLKGQGKTNGEIARLVGYTEPWVSQILRQPWAQKRLIDELKSISGRDGVRELISSSAIAAVQRLIVEMDNDAAKSAERATAARTILEYHLGKPQQHVEVEQTITHISGNIAEVDEELEKLKKEEEFLLGKN